MRPPASLMAQISPAQLDAVVAASPIAAEYLTDQDPVSAKEMLAAQLAPAGGQSGASEPAGPTAGGTRHRSTKPPEHGLDWGGLAEEGGRFVRSGTFNTILRGVFGVLGVRSSRRR
jgi:hypothetical protein